MSQEILLSGYYGYRNFGDDIFCQVAAWGASTFWQRQARFMVPDLPQFPSGLVIHKPEFFRNKVAARSYQYFESFRAGLKVYSGGSIFSRKPDRFYSLYNLDLLLSAFGKEFGAVGVSIGPFRSAGDFNWIKNLLSKFSFISTRDKASYEILQDMRLPGSIIQAFDLAVLYPLLIEGMIVKKEDRSLKRIGVSVCHYERYVGKDTNVEKEREDQLLKALELLLTERSDVVLTFFSMSGQPKRGDREISLSFIKQLEKFGDRIQFQEYAMDTKVIFDEIGNCDLLLGVRLHSGVMAYTAGVPFILVEYHPKCTAFLDDIHYPSIYRCGNPAVEHQALATNIGSILDQGKAGFFQHLLPLKNAQEEAMKNFTEAPWMR